LVIALAVELLVGRKQLMVRKQDRAPLAGVLNLINHPLGFSWVKRSWLTQEFVVKRGIQTDQLPMLVSQTEEAGFLAKLLEQSIKRGSTGVLIVVPG
jgi:hypothetical protein